MRYAAIVGLLLAGVSLGGCHMANDLAATLVRTDDYKLTATVKGTVDWSVTVDPVGAAGYLIDGTSAIVGNLVHAFDPLGVIPGGE